MKLSTIIAIIQTLYLTGLGVATNIALPGLGPLRTFGIVCLISFFGVLHSALNKQLEKEEQHANNQHQ